MPYIFELHFPKCYISYLTPMVTYIYASCCQRHNVDTDAADPMGQTAVRHRKLSLWYFSVTWYPLLLAEIGWKNPSQLNLGLFWSCHIKICAIQTWCTMAMKAWNDKKRKKYICIQCGSIHNKESVVLQRKVQTWQPDFKVLEFIAISKWKIACAKFYRVQNK